MVSLKNGALDKIGTDNRIDTQNLHLHRENMSTKQHDDGTEHESGEPEALAQLLDPSELTAIRAIWEQLEQKGEFGKQNRGLTELLIPDYYDLNREEQRQILKGNRSRPPRTNLEYFREIVLPGAVSTYEYLVGLLPAQLRQPLELSEGFRYLPLEDLLEKIAGPPQEVGVQTLQQRREEWQAQVLLEMMKKFIKQDRMRSSEDEPNMRMLDQRLTALFDASGGMKYINLSITNTGNGIVGTRWDDVSDSYGQSFNERVTVFQLAVRRFGFDSADWCVYNRRIKEPESATLKLCEGRDPEKDTLAIRFKVADKGRAEKLKRKIVNNLPEGWKMMREDEFEASKIDPEAKSQKHNPNSIAGDTKYFIVIPGSRVPIEVQFESLLTAYGEATWIVRAFGSANEVAYQMNKAGQIFRKYFPKNIFDIDWQDPATKEYLDQHTYSQLPQKIREYYELYHVGQD